MSTYRFINKMKCCFNVVDACVCKNTHLSRFADILCVLRTNTVYVFVTLYLANICNASTYEEGKSISAS